MLIMEIGNCKNAKTQKKKKIALVCLDYSCKWHIEYQPPKCTIVVYSGSQNFVVLTGFGNIEEGTSYKLLRIQCDKYLSLDENVKVASAKLKSTLVSLANFCIHEGGFSPLTSKHIYKTIVFPKALYGGELWNNLFPKHLHMLDK